jgi:hypothetical protein
MDKATTLREKLSRWLCPDIWHQSEWLSAMLYDDHGLKEQNEELWRVVAGNGLRTKLPDWMQLKYPLGRRDKIAAGTITAEQIPCGSLAADPLPRDPEEAQEVKPIITGTPSELCKTFDLVSMEFLGDVGEDLGQILAGGTVIKFNQTDSEGPLKPCLIRHVPIGTAMVVTKQIRDGKKQRSTFIKSGSTSGVGWIAFSETRLDWDNSSAYTHSAGH